MALDIWPGHTSSVLKHSICLVRNGASFEPAPFTGCKQEENSCRTARRHQDPGWRAAYMGWYRPPSTACPTRQTLIRQEASYPHCGLSYRMGREAQSRTSLFHRPIPSALQWCRKHTAQQEGYVYHHLYLKDSDARQRAQGPGTDPAHLAASAEHTRKGNAPL